jgi:glycosyltransferase involved in cell wall biosynthesis
MKRIKVLFTIPNFDTAGSGKALLNIAQGLDSEKFEVHIMCLHNKGFFFKTVEDSGLQIHLYNFTPPARPLSRMINECWKLSRKFREIAPDVIHSYHYGPNYTEALAARIARIPWIFTKKNMNWGGKSKNAWLLRSFLAKRIVVQNMDMLSKFYKNSSKTILIPRGVDVAHFQALNLSNIEFVLKDERRFIICVANIVPIKGIETLVQAFNNLHNRFPIWNLLIVGEDTNDYANELKQLVIQFNLVEKVIFTGKQRDVRPYLTQAEIFVLPTKEKGEGSPVALLEAMANGKIVIGSNIPGIRDQLKKFPNSLFDASNVEELTLKLKIYMGKTREELKLLGNSFQDHVNTEYPIGKEIKKHAELYKSIVSK